MKKVLVVCALLALATAANADSRIFLTKGGASIPVGLDNFANALIPTVSSVDSNNTMTNRYDYATAAGDLGLHTIHQIAVTDFGAYPGTGAFPTNTAAGDTSFVVGDVAYIWFQFNRDASGNFLLDAGDKLNGLKLTGDGADFTAAWYLQNDGVVYNTKRWDGNATPPGYPEWISHRGTTQTLVGVNAAGLTNAGADQTWNLFSGKNGGGIGASTQGRIALLGAIRFEGAGTFSFTLNEYNYANNATGPMWMPTGITVTPEPASMILLALAGLLIRRR